MEIQMMHGAGGELMNRLLAESILKNLTSRRIGEVELADLDDGASISLGDKEIVVSTDSYTISPVFFPGGDIGKLAACGTINDISVMGARPIALASAVILEEGFLTEDLEKIMHSMDASCREVGISVITGDTKVMQRNAIDKIVITTTGIGFADRGKVIKDSNLAVGDKIIVTGTIGDHGIALMSFREGFGFETTLQSDVAPLWPMIEGILKIGGITAMRDPTRGGLSAALNDWARKSSTGIVIDEESIPLRDEVIAASEMLGIDPLVVTNEGKAIIGVRPERAEEVLETIRATELGSKARIIGEVKDKYKGKVILNTAVGGKRIIEPPLGDPIPRIC
ncbi:MAG: hydrogenase expression/formation protein HypE [Candidatus Methanoperedens sp.]|nr:hydrogenase expression/formation protein HypE [Candidatus Methanoperedens nitroreducens]MDJ1422951.1 hydrogenase expression/formation protein HypE [Candidatus Methanoperedens sp.]